MYTMLMKSDSSSMSGGGTSGSPFVDMPVGVIIAGLVISIIITAVVFTTIVERKKAPRGRFLKWLREYLNFRSILLSGLIKFVYLFSATTLTILSLIFMFSGKDEMLLTTIGIGVAVIVFGNVLLRLFLELIMINIGIWDNTSDMRAVLVRDDEIPEPKVQKHTEKEAPKETPKKPAAEKGVEIAEKPAPAAPTAPAPAPRPAERPSPVERPNPAERPNPVQSPERPAPGVPNTPPSSPQNL